MKGLVEMSLPHVIVNNSKEMSHRNLKESRSLAKKMSVTVSVTVSVS